MLLKKLTAALAALIVAVLALFSGSALPARAATNGIHWSTYSNTGVRWVYVYDRTSDINTHNALLSYITVMNNLASTYTALPFFYYIDNRQPGAIGVCGNFGSPLPVLSICNGDPGAGFEAYTRWSYNPSNGHVGNAWTIARAGRSYAFEYTVMCHEIGHAIGLDHINNDASCMQPVLTPGQDDNKGYVASDFSDLIGVYYSHYPN